MIFIRWRDNIRTNILNKNDWISFQTKKTSPTCSHANHVDPNQNECKKNTHTTMRLFFQKIAVSHQMMNRSKCQSTKSSVIAIIAFFYYTIVMWHCFFHCIMQCWAIWPRSNQMPKELLPLGTYSIIPSTIPTNISCHWIELNQTSKIIPKTIEYCFHYRMHGFRFFLLLSHHNDCNWATIEKKSVEKSSLNI